MSTWPMTKLNFIWPTPARLLLYASLRRESNAERHYSPRVLTRVGLIPMKAYEEITFPHAHHEEAKSCRQ